MASIVVAGGGLAGLACAWKLRRAGHEVEVLERRRVGEAPVPGFESGWLRASDLDVIAAAGVLGISWREGPARSDSYLCRGRFEVLPARSGEEGIELFRSHGPEIRCSLVDLTMPGRSGLEVVAALRGIDPDARLILMSGHANEVVGTLREWGEETAFLKKPFSWNDLAGRLERTLRRSRALRALEKGSQRSTST